jgi:hypothetical protein
MARNGTANGVMLVTATRRHRCIAPSIEYSRLLSSRIGADMKPTIRNVRTAGRPPARPSAIGTAAATDSRPRRISGRPSEPSTSSGAAPRGSARYA